MALFCGLLILIGAVAMTKFQRLREVALLKTLGASSRTIVALLVIEYGVLGLLAGLVGAIGALGLSYVFARRVLDIPGLPRRLTAAPASRRPARWSAAVGRRRPAGTSCGGSRWPVLRAG